MISADQVKDWQILIVDDHADSREVVSFTLESYGAQVIRASNGIEGLALLKSAKVTFALLDLSMPGMDGWEMLKHLRHDRQTADLPVVALTAHAMEGDRERVMEAGFDGYLTKPFSPMSLLRDLTDVFNETPGLAERIKSRSRHKRTI